MTQLADLKREWQDHDVLTLINNNDNKAYGLPGIVLIKDITNSWNIQTTKSKRVRFDIKNFGIEFRTINFELKMLYSSDSILNDTVFRTGLQNISGRAVTLSSFQNEYFNIAGMRELKEFIDNFINVATDEEIVWTVDHPQINFFNINKVFIKSVRTGGWNASDGITLDFSLVEYVDNVPTPARREETNPAQEYTRQSPAGQ